MKKLIASSALALAASGLTVVSAPAADAAYPGTVATTCTVSQGYVKAGQLVSPTISVKAGTAKPTGTLVLGQYTSRWRVAAPGPVKIATHTFKRNGLKPGHYIFFGSYLPKAGSVYKKCFTKIIVSVY